MICETYKLNIRRLHYHIKTKCMVLLCTREMFILWAIGFFMRTFQKLTKEPFFLIILFLAILVLGTVTITALSSDRALVESLLSEQPDGEKTLATLQKYDSLTPEEAFQLRFEQLNAQQQDSGEQE